MFSFKVYLLNFLPAPLDQWDLSLFHKMNGEWHNGFWDAVLPFVREPFFWAPLYFFLGLFVLINFRLKGLWWVLAFLVLVAVSDFTSSTLIKETFFRVRPCRDPLLAGHIRFLVKYCPMSSSFVSSHAMNHFAISAFIFATFRKPFSNKWAFIFLWAAMISYAQVYVGVHYPVDIFSGALLGFLTGSIIAFIFNRLVKLEEVSKS